MTSVALSVLVMCQLFVLFCSIVMCVWLWCGPYGQFWGAISFLFIIACFIFVFSRSSSGDVKGLLGTFSRCDHIDRVQVKDHGGVPSTFKTKPGFRPQVSPLVGKFSAHIYIHIYTYICIYVHSTQIRARCHLCTGHLRAVLRHVRLACRSPSTYNE